MSRILFVSLCTYFSIHFVHSQYRFGVGAAIHRYDQVLSLKLTKEIKFGSVGAELGLGVERSLQGAMAPQLAFYWYCVNFPSNVKNSRKCLYPVVRYQLDFQKSAILDVYHGFYTGFGCTLGNKKQIDIQFSVGFVLEKMYGAEPSLPKGVYFLNPQLQCNYQLFNK